MSDPIASKGYVIITGTAPVNLSATPICGFIPRVDTVIASITHPASPDNVTRYVSNAAALVSGRTFKADVWYPYPATAITLTSGSLEGILA